MSQIDSLFSQLFRELFYLMIPMLVRLRGTEIELHVFASNRLRLGHAQHNFRYLIARRRDGDVTLHSLYTTVVDLLRSRDHKPNGIP